MDLLMPILGVSAISRGDMGNVSAAIVSFFGTKVTFILATFGAFSSIVIEYCIASDKIGSEEFEAEINHRASTKNLSMSEKELLRKSMWGKEVFIEVKELKKLYANKCIVLPNALLKECVEESTQVK